MMQAQYAQTGSIAAITPMALSQLEPSLRYVDGASASTDPQIVSVATANADVTVAIAAPGGVCAFARLDANGQPSSVTTKSPNACTAASAPNGDLSALTK
jgi:hypothetical protein